MDGESAQTRTTPGAGVTCKCRRGDRPSDVPDRTPGPAVPRGVYVNSLHPKGPTKGRRGPESPVTDLLPGPLQSEVENSVDQWVGPKRSFGGSWRRHRTPLPHLLPDVWSGPSSFASRVAGVEGDGPGVTRQRPQVWGRTNPSKRSRLKLSPDRPHRRTRPSQTIVDCRGGTGHTPPPSFHQGPPP